MNVIKKINADDDEGITLLVVGTEGRNIFIIDGGECKIINKFKLAGMPSSICCHGAYDTDFRIYVACRNEIIYIIRNNEVQKTIIQVSSKIINMERLEKALYVACMSSYYHAYNPSGTKVFSIKQPAEIYSLELCDLKQTRKIKLILLGLRNNEIRLYNDRVLLNSIVIQEVILGLKFGRLGKTDENMIIVTDKGSIYIKQLDKAVSIDGMAYKKVNFGMEESTLNIPKKTTMFLDLMEREKEYYKSKSYY